MSLRATMRGTVGTLSVDVELDTAGGTLVVVGPNGAGKSSVLSMLLGARKAEGRITLGDTVLLDSAARIEVPLEERRIGWVPQDYALFPHLTVRENVAFGRAGDETVDEVLRQLELVTLASRKPSTLSGGERQRVALARALAVSPRALLLDEPLAALDVHARREVRAFLKATLQRLGLPTVVVTHEPADARELGGQMVVLEAGRVSQRGTWDELVAAPKTAFVRELTYPSS